MKYKNNNKSVDVKMLKVTGEFGDKNRYAVVRKTLKKYMRDNHGNINVNEYDFDNIKSYKARTKNIITNKTQIHGTNGYMFIKGNTEYKVYEIPSRKNKNEQLAMYVQTARKGDRVIVKLATLVVKKGDVVKALSCFKPLGEGQEFHYKLVEYAHNFNNVFSMFRETKQNLSETEKIRKQTMYYKRRK